MSLHYIIDGYNVVKQVKFLTDKKLRTGREGLCRFIERYSPQGSKRNEVTIVFDGKAQVEAPPVRSCVKVIFSKNETADEKIKRMVESCSNPKRVVVVSDDRQIIYYCRALGAKIKSVKQFLADISDSKKANEYVEQEEKPSLNSDIAAEITEQLKSIWLKK